jgi:hypothetical protein
VLSPSFTKYTFRIRTKQGMVVDNLSMHGSDEADAKRKLRQIYQHCEILERSVLIPNRRRENTTFEEVISLVTK